PGPSAGQRSGTPPAPGTPRRSPWPDRPATPPGRRRRRGRRAQRPRRRRPPAHASSGWRAPTALSRPMSTAAALTTARAQLAAADLLGTDAGPEAALRLTQPGDAEQLLEPLAGGLVGDRARDPAHEDAPPRVREGVVVVELEGDRPRVDRGREGRVAPRAEGDRGVVHDVVDREDDHLAAVLGGDPSDRGRPHPTQALLEVQHVQPAVVTRRGRPVRSLDGCHGRSPRPRTPVSAPVDGPAYVNLSWR